jgi:glycosyltransferase involved in cell wall biosynthesis
MNITYVGPIWDSSGYAEAARNNIAALYTVGVDVNVKQISFERFKSDLGDLGKLVSSRINACDPGNIQIIHTTPNVFNQHYIEGKYNIGYTVWETDRLPEEWVPECNRMQEIWVPCQHNVEAFKRSGVTKPVICVPHAFNSNYLSGDRDELPIQNIDENDFVFYSIFQWTERKNPIGLLKAYLTEFKENENVVLVLKTYMIDPTNKNEKETIKDQIKSIKAALHLGSYPKILLISSLLSSQQIKELHRIGDCFISLHSCEGFGVPIVEAMLSDSTIITTGYGGPDDFIINGVTGYSIPYTMSPVCNMPWSHYRGNQNWASPDLGAAKVAMRDCFERNDPQLKQGAKDLITKKFSWEVVGNLMKDRLKEIAQ